MDMQKYADENNISESIKLAAAEALGELGEKQKRRKLAHAQNTCENGVHIGVFENILVDSLQNVLVAGIGGHHKGAVDMAVAVLDARGRRTNGLKSECLLRDLHKITS